MARKKKPATLSVEASKNGAAFNVAALRTAHEELTPDVTIEIVDDVGQSYRPPVRMTFAAVDSARFQSARRAAILASQSYMPTISSNGNGKAPLTKEEEDQIWAWDMAVTRETLSRAVVRWEGLEEHGQPVPVTVENARLFFDFQHIREQAIMKGVGNTPAARFRAVERSEPDADAG